MNLVAAAVVFGHIPLEFHIAVRIDRTGDIQEERWGCTARRAIAGRALFVEAVAAFVPSKEALAVQEDPGVAVAVAAVAVVVVVAEEAEDCPWVAVVPRKDAAVVVAAAVVVEAFAH